MHRIAGDKSLVETDIGTVTSRLARCESACTKSVPLKEDFDFLKAITDGQDESGSNET